MVTLRELLYAFPVRLLRRQDILFVPAYSSKKVSHHVARLGEGFVGCVATITGTEFVEVWGVFWVSFPGVEPVWLRDGKGVTEGAML